MIHKFTTTLKLKDGRTIQARLLGEACSQIPGFSAEDLASISILPSSKSISHGAVISWPSAGKRVLWGIVAILPLSMGGCDSKPLYPRPGAYFVAVVDDDGTDELAAAEEGGADRNKVFIDRINKGNGTMVYVNGETGSVTVRGRRAVLSDNLLNINGRFVLVKNVQVG